MTFDNSAWAINGALLSASLARRAEYAAVGGAQGVVLRDDLKVTALAVPGIGVNIAPGVALVTNNYQTTPNETYVCSNPGVHAIPSEEMPASSGSARSFIVAVVVGDPDFSQAGHPWMGAGDPPLGEEEDFVYVRPTLIQVANSSVTELNVNYPAYPLARIDLPASTTTVTNAMITDLRSLARPRQEQQIFTSAPGSWTNASPIRMPTGGSFANWGVGQFQPSVKVPEWATRAIVVANVNGVRLGDVSANVSGYIRANLGSVTGASVTYDYSTGGGAIRDNLQSAGEYNVASIAGTTVNLTLQGYQNAPGSPTNNQRPTLQTGSQVVFDVRFFED